MKTITFILLIFSSVCYGQIINFPDNNFKNALLNHDPVIDLNGDGEIQVSEAAAFVQPLHIDNKNISDMTGIKNFINLEQLVCMDNNLTTLDVSNIPLKFLICRENQIDILNVSNTNLFYLDCSDNLLTAIDMSQLTELNELHCWNNLISNLDVSALPNLWVLYCSYNQIQDLGSLPTSLGVLLADSNLLTNINLENSTNLHTLDVSDNNLSSIDISNTMVDRLSCSNNQITSLEVINNGNGFPLSNLECAGNLITELNLEDTWVIGLDCSNNPHLESINLRNGYNSQFNYSVSNFGYLPLLESVCIDNRNPSLTGFIQNGAGHNVDFYTSENCDVLLGSLDNQISPLTISPNPVKNILNINSEYGFKNAQIFNAMGQKVFSEENLNTKEIDVSNLKSGVYFLKLTDEENNSTVKKFIKE